jgi:hypothetical protein
LTRSSVLGVAMAGAEATTATSSSTYLPPALPASRQDIQAAVAKAAELRALHAALLQGGANAGASFASASRSPAVIRLPPAASPALSRAGVAAPAAAEDYPVFAPVNQTSNCYVFLQPCVPVLLHTVVWERWLLRSWICISCLAIQFFFAGNFSNCLVLHLCWIRLYFL